VHDHYLFAFEPRVARFSALFGVNPATAWVDVDEDDLTVRFGAWRLVTPRRNIEGGQVTGPYQLAKVAGPAHLSLADRGVTFATTTRRGVCFTLLEPVPGIEPFGWLRHPGVTVTVAEPERLLEAAPLR
jgi:hypothetical protein